MLEDFSYLSGKKKKQKNTSLKSARSIKLSISIWFCSQLRCIPCSTLSIAHEERNQELVKHAYRGLFSPSVQQSALHQRSQPGGELWALCMAVHWMFLSSASASLLEPLSCLTSCRGGSLWEDDQKISTGLAVLSLSSRLWLSGRLLRKLL